MTVDTRDVPSQPGGESGAYPGVTEVLELLRITCRRPRRGELPGREVDELPRGRHGLPLVCVVRPSGSPILRTLASSLSAARPGQIPHTHVSCSASQRGNITVGSGTAPPVVPPQPAADHVDPEWTATAAVADILAQLARSLGSTRNSRYGRIRFHRFGLAHWLSRQDVANDDIDPDRVLLSRMRQRAIARHRLGGSGDQLLAVAPNSAPAWMRMLMVVVPPLWFLIRASGRIPMVSQPYRWLLRQPYLAPRDPGTFIGFAERLTVRGRAEEDPEQLRKLLVNAFLEDLRAAYRRRPWRPRGARRTTYPVVFLDDVTRDNGGYRLLKLINDVRSETGSFDPLVVFSGSERVPPSAAPAGGGSSEYVWPADRAREGYEAWCRQFAADSRSRKPTAWYLPIEVTPQPADGLGDSRRPPVLARFVVPDPPLWARRATVMVAVVALVAAGATAASLVYQDAVQWRVDHCGASPDVPLAEFLDTEPGSTPQDPHCWGISDGTYQFSKHRGVRDVIAKIHEQNLALDGRPYFTLVHFSALDEPSAQDHLELAGAAARQRDYNRKGGAAQLRLLVANGGRTMLRGTATAKLIGDLAATDPSIVGVMGMSQSRVPTQQTIIELGRRGLPVIASALSADILAKQSPMYLQVSPQNLRQAEVAAKYATSVLGPALGPEREVTVIQSNDAEDIYSSDLAKDLTDAFRRPEAGYTVRPPLHYVVDGASPLTNDPQPAEDIGRDMCGRNGVVLFTGRSTDFKLFLGGVDAKCRSNPPAILAGDDVSRYVAERADRERYGVAFQYLAFAVGRTRCETAGLYNNLKEIVPAVCEDGSFNYSLDGHAALSYDAASVATHAIDAVLRNGLPVTPGTFWHQLTTMTGNDTIDGETGKIDFNGILKGRYMKDKAVAVMKVDGSGQASMIGICGPNRDPQASWCADGS